MPESLWIVVSCEQAARAVWAAPSRAAAAAIFVVVFIVGSFRLTGTCQRHIDQGRCPRGDADTAARRPPQAREHGAGACPRPRGRRVLDRRGHATATASPPP